MQRAEAPEEVAVESARQELLKGRDLLGEQYCGFVSPEAR